MEFGLLVLRLLLGGIMFVHGTQKTAGWFKGPGFDKSAVAFANLGQHPGRLMVGVAAFCELAGGALAAVGLATPLAAVIVASTMLVAGLALSRAKGGVWYGTGGGEYPLVLAVLALVLGFTGPGKWSVDAAFSAPWVNTADGSAVITGLVVAAVSLLGAVPPLLRRAPVAPVEEPAR
jgi:putative oxidoreductase